MVRIEVEIPDNVSRYSVDFGDQCSSVS
jgi:hypothetical protein